MSLVDKSQKGSQLVPTSSKQRSAIEKVKSENSKLKDELLLENKLSTLPPNPAATVQIQKLQDQADMYTRKIELEKRRVSELDKQIAMMNQKITEQRKKMGGVNAARENSQQIQKQIKILENRLDKALQKYNEALAHNRKLRENIDNLRRERLVFDNIYKKLEKELAEKKKEMAHIIEVSNKAYEARDAAVNEMSRLKQQADKEQAAFEAEWRELGRLIETDRKARDFMKHRQKDKQEDPKSEMSLEEETKLRKKVIKGNWNIAKDKAAQQVSMEKVQSYGEAFAKIQAATGITDIDELVTTFINAEDENFRLFKYVDELNQEIARLEEQIAEIKNEIEKYKGHGVSTDNQRKKILKELEEKLLKTEAKAEQYEHKYSAAVKTVNALKVGIWNIFNKIGCNTPATREMLGSEGVTEQNMMQFLGIIEQRTNEILQMYAANQQSGEDAAVASVLGQGPQTAAGSTVIAIDPPSTTEELASDSDEEEEEEDRPLTRDELQAKTLKNLGRKSEVDKKKLKRREPAMAAKG